jgi:PIN domain nuclease of toxin-antitoxin system
MVFIDTHIAAWLYQNSLKHLSKKMLHSLDINDIRISPVVILELEYLYEIGRVRENSSIVIDYLSNKLDLEIDDCSFSDVIKFSVRESWTRDPFDRIIVAHARSKDAFLITKDSNMKKYYKKIIS